MSRGLQHGDADIRLACMRVLAAILRRFKTMHDEIDALPSRAAWAPFRTQITVCFRCHAVLL